MAGEWRSISFGQLLAEPVRNGIYKQKEFHGRGAKIVNMGELFAHPRLRAVPMKRVELSDSESERFTLAEGDLLFARRSLVAEGAGKCSVVLDIDEPTTFESSIIRARPDRTKADSLFLYYFFNSTSGLHCLDTIRRQVAVAGITGSDLARLEFTLPPLPEQRAIAHILGTLDDKIELNRRMSETLEAMARALFKAWFIDFDPVRRNAARARNQPSPGAARHPLPEGEGHYRGGYDFAGLVETARTLREKQTSAEAIFWELVRNRRFLNLKFRRQHQLGDYVVDFYCHEHRLVVELDGGVHGDRKKKDQKRDAWMQAQGFKVLRFPNEQLLDDPLLVLSAIAEVVKGSASHPLPLGEGWGEGVVESMAFDHLFPARLVDSELGEIPEGWE
ncbi:MAG TPA: DUF559 domain-containing protein, partial [Thermoanaerobaculaceae bacterium]|nr:DUF559 domain-containing protein [Thermoanaerobaculaceae bacterium]